MKDWECLTLENIKNFKHQILKLIRLLLTTLELSSAQVIINFLHFLIIVLNNFWIFNLWRRWSILHMNISWSLAWNSFYLLSSFDLHKIIIQLNHFLIRFNNHFFCFFSLSWFILLLIKQWRTEFIVFSRFKVIGRMIIWSFLNFLLSI